MVFEIGPCAAQLLGILSLAVLVILMAAYFVIRNIAKAKNLNPLKYVLIIVGTPLLLFGLVVSGANQEKCHQSNIVIPTLTAVVIVMFVVLIIPLCFYWIMKWASSKGPIIGKKTK